MDGEKPVGFLIHEQRCWWAPLLRRMAPGWPVTEARRWEECREQWTAERFLVLEATQELLEPLMARLRLARQMAPDMPVGVVARAELLPLRWAIREAGAAAFVTTALELRGWGKLLVRLRHRQRTRASTPHRVSSKGLMSWEEGQARLPWGER